MMQAGTVAGDRLSLDTHLTNYFLTDTDRISLIRWTVILVGEMQHYTQATTITGSSFSLVCSDWLEDAEVYHCLSARN